MTSEPRSGGVGTTGPVDPRGAGPGAARADDGASDRTDPASRAQGSDRLPEVSERNAGHPPRDGMPRYDQIPHQLAETLRSVVNRHELRAGEPLPRSIAVAAAQLGEGVTTISQALATIIAEEMDKFVCWVDCSWMAEDDVDPDDDRTNLADILADHSRIHSALYSSNELPRLVRLSPGPMPDASRNRVARSPEFERLLEILTDEFDHVIFDLPPLLTNASALSLLRRADTALLVVRHRSTSIAHVERAMASMEATPNLAVVLNRFDTRIPTRLRRLLGD